MTDKAASQTAEGANAGPGQASSQARTDHAAGELKAQSGRLKPERRIRVDSPGRRAWRQFRRHKLAMVGGLMLLIIVILAVGAPLFSRYDPNKVDLRQITRPPSTDHWLGTDRTGRDVWTRTIYAGRISLSVGIVSISLSTFIGTVLGAFSGYYRGQVDNIIMRFTDVIMTFPPLVILLSIVAIVGPGIFNLMVIIGLLSWPPAARIVRSVFFSLREYDFVMAAHCLGVPPGRIIIRHILPGVFAPLIVYISLGVAAAILLEAGLSFLSLGVPPPTPSWGNMLNAARSLSVLELAPWMWIPPGVMTVLSVLAINFIGDGLRDALDPRAER